MLIDETEESKREHIPSCHDTPASTDDLEEILTIEPPNVYFVLQLRIRKGNRR